MTTKQIIEMAKQAGFSMENSAAIQAAERFAQLVRSATLAEPVVESVKFLANGTRFKMSFFHNEDSEGQVAEGMYVTCFEGFEDELNGRWVALVPAEDDCHMKLKASPPPAQPAPVPLLSDEEVAQCIKDASKGSAINRDGSTSQRIVRSAEQLVRRKARL